LNISRERSIDFNFLLTRYGNERLLYRLAGSRHRDQFVLKGATLFEAWRGHPYRATRDVDLLGFGDASIQRLERVFRELCLLNVEADGIHFLENTVRGEEIREQQEYGAVRVRLTADLDGAHIPLQVDIVFGEAVTPGIEETEFPTLLDFRPPHLRTYPRETVVAEKFEAMVRLGLINSRMKDFYDLWTLASTYAFSGSLLARAFTATFERRGTPLPSGVPVALTSEFIGERTKRQQWTAFVRRSGITTDLPLPEVADLLMRFLLPPVLAAAAGKAFEDEWVPGGDWRVTG
jgi:predicted nucleotidyltransferase component of viral defense system